MTDAILLQLKWNRMNGPWLRHPPTLSVDRLVHMDSLSNRSAQVQGLVVALVALARVSIAVPLPDPACTNLHPAPGERTQQARKVEGFGQLCTSWSAKEAALGPYPS